MLRGLNEDRHSVSLFREVMVGERIPEALVILGYFLTGSYLAFLLHGFTATTKDEVHVPTWSLCFALGGSFLAALTLNISRRRAQRITWWHNYTSGAGCLLVLLCGVLLTSGASQAASSYIGGLGYGAMTTSGFAYLHFRANTHRNRSISVGLCYLVWALGILSSVQFIRHREDSYNPRFGAWITSISAIVFVLVVANELLHRFGFYNYKMSLDESWQKADERGDSFQSVLRNNIAHENWFSQKKVYPVTANICKFVNSIVMIYLFLNSAIFANQIVPYAFLLAGIVLGLILTRFFNSLVIYRGSVTLYLVLVIGAIFSANPYILLWISYVVAGVGLHTPDLMTMELCSPKSYDIALFFSFLTEHLVIGFGVYLAWGTTDLDSIARLLAVWFLYLWVLVLFVLAKIWFRFNYPVAPDNNLIQIRHMIKFGLPPPQSANGGGPPYQLDHGQRTDLPIPDMVYQTQDNFRV